MQTLKYIGSKHTLGGTLRDKLVEVFGDLSDTPLVDAFFGSGAFTIATHNLFADLWLNDLELYSYLIAHALFHEPADFSGVTAGDPAYFTRTYCAERLFFTEENGRYADAFRAWARTLEDGPARRSAMGCLLSAMDRRANTTAVYGAFLKKRTASSMLPVAAKSLFIGHAVGSVHITLRDATAACLAAPAGALLYMDPPYTKRPYANNYFVLNVMGNPDEEPEVKGVTGIPVSGWNRSMWNRKEGALFELGRILRGTAATKVAMSYSTDGLMARAEVVECFDRCGWTCSVHEIEQRRFKSHSTGKQNETQLVELLFTGEKRAAVG
jgi:adenine-specific DNA-methyltransferase